MPVTIKTNSGGGSVTLDSGSSALDTTLTLPNTTGTVVNTAPGTTGNVLTSNGTTWTSAAPASPISSPTAIGQIPFSTDGSTYTATQKIVQSTAVTLTTQTAVDFTSIPSWVKRVTVMFNGVSTNGSSNLCLQIGAGSITSSGYTSSASSSTNGAPTSTSSFILTAFVSAATSQSGHAVLTSLGSNTWVQSGISAFSNGTYTNLSGGNVALSGALDRVRITTVGGTDTFDAGSINILYE
jgi:hypothetical protein